MISVTKKGLSLLEVLITTAILSSAIIFVFRAFTTALSAARFSQNITLACFLAEDKFQEWEERQKELTTPLGLDAGREKKQARDFNWNYETNKLADSNLIELKFNVSWKESIRQKDYVLDFFTYLLAKK
ncbi:MAG: prepilin-type N-terminal cleavage/methylation domain-containing protein [Candidatus Omnitrophica bacterium]|nr:prepilin-type N-terminal cleavage/methylation domain-containing protein [Candidatus Omnitrophota bacterium]